MLITTGTCVSRIITSSAGSRGSRRRHDSLRPGGLSLRGLGCSASTAPAVAFITRGRWPLGRRLPSHHPFTCEAMDWQFLSAESIEPLPAITAENCCVHWLPTSWNCGMPTYCTRSEEHTSELQSRLHLVCRLLLEKKTNH